MNSKMTLNLDSLTVTSFETEVNENGGANAATVVGCGTGCNTRLTCSTNLC